MDHQAVDMAEVKKKLSRHLLGQLGLEAVS
jgi:hypothetical protein